MFTLTEIRAIVWPNNKKGRSYEAVPVKIRVERNRIMQRFREIEEHRKE